MKIDCHVHSYPLAIPGNCFGIITPKYSGLKLSQLEKNLKEKENFMGEMHGIFYGGNDPRLLPKKPENDYLLKRVLPMMESHPLQLIGVTSWGNPKFFEYLNNSQTQINAINLIADEGGLAIIDQPKSLYEKPDENMDGVFLGHKGEATIEELSNLSKETKKRTFLCYDGILPSKFIPPFIDFRGNAEKVSEETGLKLVGGSDTILNPSSLFSAYTSANTKDIRTLLDDPSLFGELHKGAAPWYDLERVRRIMAAGVEELMGLEKREKRHEEMLQDYLKN